MKLSDKLTYEKLVDLGVCEGALESFQLNFPEGGSLENVFRSMESAGDEYIKWAAVLCWKFGINFKFYKIEDDGRVTCVHEEIDSDGKVVANHYFTRAKNADL